MSVKEQKKIVYYIGFYDGDSCSKRRRNKQNMAGTVYMKGLIHLLREMDYHVILVSLQYAQQPGVYSREHIVVDDGTEQYFLPYFSIKLAGRTVGRRTIIYALEHFINRQIKKDDIVISYHSLVYGEIIKKAHRKIGFTWIPEVNEIYCLSRQDYSDPLFLSKEIEMFDEGNGYIFANDILAKEYSRNNPSIVLYGNYDIIVPQKQLSTDIINITYTGIINEDRGVFKIIQAMEKLPENYQLHILGFGDEKNISRLLEEIGLSNKKAGIQRIFYYGTKAGKEYSDFLADKHIGVSLISQNEDICNNAFPGKILSYLGHSLYVLSSSCNSICNSRLGNWLYYCDNSVESIAESILRIPIYQECRSSEILKELQKQFKLDFSKMISKIQENNNGH